MIKKEEITALREENFAEIRSGKTATGPWIFFYCFGIVFGFFISILLPVAGLGMAYYYALGKSTDADGNEYYVYDEQTRQKGNVMLFGGITVLVLEIVFFLDFVQLMDIFSYY